MTDTEPTPSLADAEPIRVRATTTSRTYRPVILEFEVHDDEGQPVFENGEPLVVESRVLLMAPPKGYAMMEVERRAREAMESKSSGALRDIVSGFIDGVLDEESAAWLAEELADPDSPIDLMPAFAALRDAAAVLAGRGRPTRPSPSGSGRRPRTSKRSTVR